MSIVVTLHYNVPKAWIAHLTQHSDVFRRGDGSGYWARGIAQDDELGWLVYDQAAEERDSTDAEDGDAEDLWRDGKPLPKNYYRFDEDFAARAYAAGVRQYGDTFYEEGDGPRYDEAIQKALFDGSPLYG